MRLAALSLLALVLAGTDAFATEVRLRHDRSGNIVSVTPSDLPGTAELIAVDPPFGQVGQTVQLKGLGLDSVGVVHFGLSDQTALVAGERAISLQVPPAAQSGPIGISVGAQRIDSSAVFVVLPTEIPSTSVAGIAAARLGEPMDIGLIGARWSLLTFSGDAAGAASLMLSSVDQPAAAPVEIRLLGPQGEVLQSTSTTLAAPAVHLTVPRTSGMHVLALRTPKWARVRATLRSDLELVADGSPTVANAVHPTPSVRLAFAAQPGESYSLGFTSLSTSVSSKRINFDLYRPNGTLWKTARCGSTSVMNQCGMVLRNLTAGGIYTLIAKPDSASTTSFSSLVYLNRNIEQAQAIGAAQSLQLARPGQIATLAFDGVAGQRLQVGISDISISGSSSRFEMVFRAPDGSCLFSGCPVWNHYPSALLELPVLPADGRYTAEVEFYNDGNVSPTGSSTITLTQDDERPIVPDSSYASVGSVLYGQRYRLAFEAMAGESYSLGVSSISTTPVDQRVTLTVIRPNGTSYRTMTCGKKWSPHDCDAVMRGLPESGTYTVLVAPTNHGTLAYSLRVWLSSEVREHLDVDSSKVLALPRPGQIANVTFNGTVGQRLQLGTSEFVATASDSHLGVVIRAPDGTCPLAPGCAPSFIGSNPSSKLFDLPTLTQDGTYSVRFDTVGAGKNSAAAATRVTLTEDSIQTINADSGYVQLTAPLHGQRHRLRFEAQAGDSYSLGVSAISTTPTDNRVTLQVVRPNGSTYRTMTCGKDWSPNQCSAVMRDLPETGTYEVLVKPSGDGMLSYSVRVWLSRELQQDIIVGASAVLALERPGRVATLSFDGVAGQRLQLGVSGAAFSVQHSSFAMVIRRPDGSCLVASNCAASTFGAAASLLEMPILPETGRYRIQVEVPSQGKNSAHGSATLALTEDLMGNIETDGAYSQVTSTLYGQRHRLQFEGLSGQSLSLGVSSLTTTPTGRAIRFIVLRPNGSILKTANCGTTSLQNQCSSEMRDLPDSGTYTVLVRNYDNTALSYSARVWLSSEIQQDIVIGTPLVLSLLRPGQIATLSFSGSAAQTLRLTMSSPATSPSNSNFEFLPLLPDGVCLLSSNCAPWRTFRAGFTDFPALPQTGPYRMRVRFYDTGLQSSSGSATLVLAPKP